MKSCVLAAAALTSFNLYAYAADAEGKFDRSLPVSGPVELDVATDSGGIVVIPGSAGAVQIRAILKGYQRGRDLADIERRIRALESNPPIEQTGNTLRIGHVSDRNLLRNISMRLEIQTPADTKLLARADSGGIRVNGIKGPVDCQTDSGGIEARQIAAGVRAVADSGGIHVHEVQGPVYLRADSGGIEATGIGGSIDAETDSGGIRLAQTVAAGVRARADSGGANLKLAPNAGDDVDVSADSGNLTLPEMTVRGVISRHCAEGKVRGGGNLADIRVGSGNLVIE